LAAKPSAELVPDPAWFHGAFAALGALRVDRLPLFNQFRPRRPEFFCRDRLDFYQFANTVDAKFFGSAAWEFVPAVGALVECKRKHCVAVLTLLRRSGAWLSFLARILVEFTVVLRQSVLEGVTGAIEYDGANALPRSEDA